MISIRIEEMGPHFTKFYLEGLPVPAVLHRFTQAEPNADPHDHPWGFTSFVIAGGYVEEVFNSHGTSKLIHRSVGNADRIDAGHVHRIVRLIGVECWTLIIPGPPERIPGFYRWDINGTPLYRQWNETEFKPLKTCKQLLPCGHPIECEGMAGTDGNQPGCGWCADIADNAILIDHLSRTYDHFSAGRISKPLTLPEEVFAIANDLSTEDWQEAYNEGYADAKIEHEIP